MAAHNLAAAKRLRKELQHLERQSKAGEQDDVYLRPSNPEESILRWTALLRGPKETPFEGGVFQLSIKCGQEYPLAPPTITFVTKVSTELCVCLCVFVVCWCVCVCLYR
jgi:peroxin-4